MPIHTLDNFWASLKQDLGMEEKSSTSKIVVAAKAKPKPQEEAEEVVVHESKPADVGNQPQVAQANQIQSSIRMFPFAVSMEPLKSEIAKIIESQQEGLINSPFDSTEIGQKLLLIETEVSKIVASFSVEKKASMKDLLNKNITDLINKKQMGKDYDVDEEDELSEEEIAQLEAEKEEEYAQTKAKEEAAAKAELSSDVTNPDFAKEYAESMKQEVGAFGGTIHAFYGDIYEKLADYATWKTEPSPQTFIDSVNQSKSYKAIENAYRSLAVTAFTFNAQNRKSALSAIKTTSSKQGKKGEFVYSKLIELLFGKGFNINDVLNLSIHSTTTIKETAALSSEIFSKSFGKELMAPINGTMNLVVDKIKSYASENKDDSSVAFRNGDFAIVESIDAGSGNPIQKIIRIEGGDDVLLVSSLVVKSMSALANINELLASAGKPEITVSESNILVNHLELYMVSSFAERQPEFKSKDVQSVMESLDIYGSFADQFSKVVMSLKWFKPGATGAQLEQLNQVDSIASVRLIKQRNNDYVAINIENHDPILVSGDDLFDMGIISTPSLQRYLSSGNAKTLLEGIYKAILKRLIIEEAKVNNDNYATSKYKNSKFFNEITSTMQKAARYKVALKKLANTGDIQVEKVVFPQNAEGSPVFGKTVNLKLNYKNRLSIFIDFVRKDPHTFQVMSSEADPKSGFKPMDEQDAEQFKAERDAIDALGGKTGNYENSVSLHLGKVPFGPTGQEATDLRKMLVENYIGYVESSIPVASQTATQAPAKKEVKPQGEVIEPLKPVEVKSEKPAEPRLDLETIEKLFREQTELIGRLKKLNPTEKERLEKLNNILEDYDGVIKKIVEKNGPEAEKALAQVQKSIADRKQKTLDPEHEAEIIAKIKKFTQDINLGKDSVTGEALSLEQIDKLKRYREQLVDMISDFGEGTLGIRPEGFNPEFDKNLALHNALKGAEGDSLAIAIRLLKMGGGASEIKKYRTNAIKNLQAYPDLTNFLTELAKSNHPKAKQVSEFIRLVGAKG